ncbi:magnesium-transporting ATPase, P-type 1 [mine drainage metagenome]|uniref:Magnesium-transporting ATPase, P-type 1 n=1 Tax=mine drainage metagenome TaxID=410659 RepID=A0A1J5QR45_9ZZZZ
MAIPSQTFGIEEASALSVAQLLESLKTDLEGLSEADVILRRRELGANVIQDQKVRWYRVIARQMNSPLLGLLAVTSFVSYFVGEHTDSIIIGIILLLSVGLGFVNEYRAELAASDLHSRIRHSVTVIRSGNSERIDIVDLVPGDIVDLQLGEVVPADIRLIEASEFESDESVLTGESLPVAKTVGVISPGAGLSDLTNSVLMGTVVHSGSGRGIVISTGARSAFGRVAIKLGTEHGETAFQIGLRKFSSLLVLMAGGLTSFVFLANVLLHRPLIDAVLFSLAIAVGITPQMLPAVVSTSLASGSRALAKRKILVKRMICIEDLGNVRVLFTDKTGTLTEGSLRLMRSMGAHGELDDRSLILSMLSCAAELKSDDVSAGDNPMDRALWESPLTQPRKAEIDAFRRLALVPFDHERRMISVVVEHEGKRLLICRGAPESILARCRDLDPDIQMVLEREFSAGGRVIAVATKEWDQRETVSRGDEIELTLVGFVVFVDPPKLDARKAIDRLERLKIDVKIITGDNALVAVNVCQQIGIDIQKVLSGPEISALSDEELCKVIPETTIFARVVPEQKARIIKCQRRAGSDVAFLGDGVNDALALHEADVGISVDTAADVAKDAADIIFLEKNLDVLADGVLEGRRIFANTIKYVLMGASSNFGNMFSAAGASAFLSFLPMLPSQILLNNLLYDSSQLAISSDVVDEEQLASPAHWNIGMIRRYMLVFGPISSIFDFGTFAILLWVFHATPELFRTGWFVESLATQTLVIFVIRTRRSPFYKSRPSIALLLACLSIVAIGVALPYTPIAEVLGFKALSGGVLAAIFGLVLIYLGLVEIGKRVFFRAPRPPRRPPPRPPQSFALSRAQRFVPKPTK